MLKEFAKVEKNSECIILAHAFDLKREKREHLAILQELLDCCKYYRHIYFGRFQNKDFVSAQIIADSEALKELKKQGWKEKEMAQIVSSIGLLACGITSSEILSGRYPSPR